MRGWSGRGRVARAARARGGSRSRVWRASRSQLLEFDEAFSSYAWSWDWVWGCLGVTPGCSPECDAAYLACIDTKIASFGLSATDAASRPTARASASSSRAPPLAGAAEAAAAGATSSAIVCRRLKSYAS